MKWWLPGTGVGGYGEPVFKDRVQDSGVKLRASVLGQEAEAG